MGGGGGWEERGVWGYGGGWVIGRVRFGREEVEDEKRGKPQKGERGQQEDTR